MKKTELRLLLIGTFTLLFFLTFAQNVGIGTTSPNYDLQIHDSSLQSVLQFTSGGSGSTSFDGFVVGQNTPAGEALIWNFENKDIEFGTNSVERFRIKADGKIGIGISSPNYNLQIHDSFIPVLQFTSGSTGTTSVDGFVVGQNTPAGEALIWNFENEDIEFGTNGSQRMLIKSDGKIGIGTPSPSATLHVISSANTTHLATTSNGAGSLGISFYYNETAPAAIRGKLTSTGINDGTGVFGSATGTDGGYGVGGVFTGNWYGLVGAGHAGATAGIFADANGAPNAIYINGNIAGTGMNNYASDGRLKKNIIPLYGALSAIEKMKPLEYEFKVGEFGSMSLPEGKHFGLIAQDVQQIYPQLVVENTFTGDSKEGFKYLGINYNELIPVLIKGMQEQQNLIEQLLKRIETLENSN